MKIIVAPDSFKGSLSAVKAAEVIRKAFEREIKNVVIDTVPMADGGEGTLDAILTSTGGTIIEVNAQGPMKDTIMTEYGCIDDGEVAVIEMAKIVGLPHVPLNQRNPKKATTFGVGEVIRHALDRGMKKFIIGIGGSATNDGGAGMLQALGVSFLDKDGTSILPLPERISSVKKVDFSSLDPRIFGCVIEVATDVTNPLCGPTGASVVFGPQKGASDREVIELDDILFRYADMVEDALQKPLRNVAGAGAGGGIGFALLALGAKLRPGAEMIAEKSRIEDRLTGADWVITGEGKSDEQTMYGKLPLFVAETAKKKGVKAILLSGSLGDGYEKLLDWFVSCHSIMHHPQSLAEAMAVTERNLYLTSRNLARLIQAAEKK